jgi:hypothetical protein
MPGLSMNRTVIILLVFIFRFAAYQVAYSQDQGMTSPGDIYLERTGSAREYIDGKDYYSYYSGLRTSPILRQDEAQSASLMIHGRVYNNLVLKYDTYTDNIIYTDGKLIYKNRNRQVALNRYHVDRFDLFFRYDTLHFRFLCHENDPAFNLNDGYYEIVHDNKTKYVIRHSSAQVIHSSPDDVSDIREYFYEPVSYVKTGNDFQRISSRKQFLNLFGSWSDEISHFLRKHAIRIKTADKEQIKDVLEYYEQLN